MARSDTRIQTRHREVEQLQTASAMLVTRDPPTSEEPALRVLLAPTRTLQVPPRVRIVHRAHTLQTRELSAPARARHAPPTQVWFIYATTYYYDRLSLPL
jgi:hypothetical protein